MGEFLVLVSSLSALCVLTIGVSAAAVQQDRADSHGRYHREVQGLYPYPRVGRSDPAWAVESGMSEAKRQGGGLIAFPRVGRSGNSDPRTMGPAAGPWLIGADIGKRGELMPAWYAQRPGRADSSEEWALFSMRDFPAMNRPQRGGGSSFTPRLGRELEE